MDGPKRGSLSYIIAVNGSTALSVRLCSSLSFLSLYTDGRSPCTGDQSIASHLPANRINTQTSMSRVGFEPTTTGNVATVICPLFL
jgi:hypothetical protein